MKYLNIKGNTKLTDSEIKILTYLNDNITEIPLLMISDVAKKTYTSLPSVIRLSKKLGFTGFADLKREYIKLLNKHDQNVEKNIIISSYINSLKQLDNLNTNAQFIKTKKIIEKSNQILFMASGTSRIIARAGVLAVRAKGYVVRLINFNEAEMKALKFLTKNDLIILISYSGKTSKIIKMTKMLPQDVKKILITTKNKNALEKICDINLYVPIQAKEFKYVSTVSRVTRLAVIDILTTMLTERKLQK